MYRFVALIGFYSYFILILGILGLLSQTPVVLVTIVFLFLSFYSFQSLNLQLFLKEKYLILRSFDKMEFVLLCLIIFQAFVNLVGALGPELSFDALWYHLTIPKIFIQEGRIFYIPGDLLHYSLMPKLVEMLYVPALMFGNEIVAKLIHFSFGIGSLIVLYKLSRLFLSRTYSLLALVIFYSNLVIGWLSITAYIDLGRTFFEVLSLYYFVLFLQKKDDKSLLFSSFALGLALSTKILALGSLLIFLPLVFYHSKNIFKVVRFIFVTLIIPLPWFVFSFIHTGNPIYPLLSGKLNVPMEITINNLLNFIHNPDPISPIYLICFPLVFIVFKKLNRIEKSIFVYALLAFVVWFVTPQTGGGRFITPYLPAFSLAAALTIQKLEINVLRTYVLLIVILVAIVSCIYRAGANYRYLPVLLGTTTKSEFLSNNLDFNFGDFYDTDYYLDRKISTNDHVLIVGIHNLYYVNFPFVHDSYAHLSDEFDYVLVGKDGSLPSTYKRAKLIYENKKTNVKLYRP